MKKNCFWKHNWGEWVQEEPQDMYFTTRWNTKLSLDYRLYIQKRCCKDCKKVEIDYRKIDY